VIKFTLLVIAGIIVTVATFRFCAFCYILWLKIKILRAVRKNDQTKADIEELKKILEKYSKLKKP
jgi:threonine/homoserine/homoserine lactone efflux protein